VGGKAEVFVGGGRLPAVAGRGGGVAPRDGGPAVVGEVEIVLGEAV
jgi:hypothetical protein